MADYPGTIPDLDTLLSDPLSFGNFSALVAEQQAVVDTLGANPQGSSATVVARIAALETKLGTLGNTGYRKLRIANNVTTPTTKIDLTADLLAIEGYLVESVSVTIDLTATGKNGTTSGRATNTWYYVWAGLHPTTGEVCGIYSTASTRAGIDVSHASLAGFTAWRRFGALRTNATGSGEFVRLTQHGEVVVFDGYAGLTSIGAVTADTWATRSLTSTVPPTSRAALVGCQVSAASASRTVVSESGVDVGRGIGYGTAYIAHSWVSLSASQEYRWKVDVANATDFAWWTVAYRDPI